MSFLILLLCVFIITWFVPFPPPFWIILVILEAIALVLWVQPGLLPMLR
jgi:hypothetical protein